MGQGFCAWWQRRKRRVWAGLYAAAALALLAAAVADPLLTALGILPERRLTLADFTPVGVETVDGSTVITATDDAQLLLEGGAMRSLWVRCSFSIDPGEFVAFYESRLDAPFGAHKMVYAHRYGDWYAFPLPYGTTRLRLDLGVAPSITVHFDEIVLNRQRPPALPTAGLVWAAVLPGLLFAVLDLLAELWGTRGLAVRRALRLRRGRRARRGGPVTVTRDTVIADILDSDPQRGSTDILLAAGMPCLGCVAASGETVAEACAVHGADADALVEELNAYFAKLTG